MNSSCSTFFSIDFTSSPTLATASQSFFLAAHLEEFARVADAGLKLAVGSDRILKELLLLGHLFGMLRVIPEIGVLDLAVQFFKTSGFEVDVKDTP